MFHPSSSVSHHQWLSVQYRQLKMINFMYNPTKYAVAQEFYKLSYEGRVNEIATNYARVQLFLQSMDVEVVVFLHPTDCNLIQQKISEREAYPLQNLLSDTGGVFGLYIGLTVVGFVELLEMLLMSVYFKMQRKRNARVDSASIGGILGTE